MLGHLRWMDTLMSIVWLANTNRLVFLSVPGLPICSGLARSMVLIHRDRSPLSVMTLCVFHPLVINLGMALVLAIYARD
jgi:hypothetical protein